MPSNEQQVRQRARHAAQDSMPMSLFILAAGLALLVIGALLGAMVTSGATSAPRTEPAALGQPSPIQAARSLSAVRDLERGDAILYYPTAHSAGVRCTFISLPAPSPAYATADCGNGHQQVKVVDIASITPAREPKDSA